MSEESLSFIMSNAGISNPPVQNESKSSKKKKAKGDLKTTVSEAPIRSLSIDATTGQSGTEPVGNGADGSYESPYIKELYKYGLN